MKSFILISILLFFVTNGFSQTKPTSKFTKEYYLQKSKDQNTAAWILLGSGTAITLAGIVYANESSKDNSFGLADDGAYFMILGGTATDLVSIPFFISSGSNARKAANFTINAQPLLFPKQNNIARNYNPSLSIKINF